ncbi:hypothetical protein NM688_g6762 [Phlebia brevispora]|uniref:Uncharacterized protein n=1 Tax=Phlebia brevispora TaxID=194682 RepID=A0ACC1SCP5_9APHY|nr:hypothetical protein NM688_g6762 [Phlebia brevispora]
MNYYIPFSTPRTPKEYKYMPEPASPLARFSQPHPEELPSLRLWKEICKGDSESDTSLSSVSTSSSGSSGEIAFSTGDSSQGSITNLLEGVKPLKRESAVSSSERAPKRVRRRQVIDKSGSTKSRKRRNSGTNSKYAISGVL